MLLVAHTTPPDATACAALAAAGADVFELDVQLRSGRLEVSHSLPVSTRLTRLEHDRGRLRWRTSRTRDPGLDDLVGAVPADCTIMLDLKARSSDDHRALASRLIAEITDRRRFVACTGIVPDLDRMRDEGLRTWRTIEYRHQLRRLLAGPRLCDEAVSIRHRLLTTSTVRRLQAIVPTVVAWTVNDLARALDLRSMAVDGITTDRREVMLALRRRPPDPQPGG